MLDGSKRFRSIKHRLRRQMFHLILLLGGDIYVNPGPNWKYPCVACKKPVKANQDGILCDDCEVWFHPKCVHIDEQEINAPDDLNKNWSCLQCILPGLIESEHLNLPASSTCENITREQQKKLKFRRGLKVGYLNVNRLYNKLDELKATLALHQFDVFGVSETWLTSEITDIQIKIPGYTAIRRDRKLLTKNRVEDW